jgi:hypothetical protein
VKYACSGEWFDDFDRPGAGQYHGNSVNEGVGINRSDNRRVYSGPGFQHIWYLGGCYYSSIKG